MSCGGDMECTDHAFGGGRGWLLALALGSAATFGGCGSDRGDPAALEPPSGRWRVTEVTGEIRTQAGGTPVLCMQASLSRRPTPLYDDGVDVRPWVELRADDAFAFAFYFEDGALFDVISNDGAVRSRGFFGDAFSRGALRSVGSWSWRQRRLEGAIEAIGSSAGAEARFEVVGSFLSSTEISGEWSFREAGSQASCWRRSRGRGTWTATASAAR